MNEQHGRTPVLARASQGLQAAAGAMGTPQRRENALPQSKATSALANEVAARKSASRKPASASSRQSACTTRTRTDKISSRSEKDHSNPFAKKISSRLEKDCSDPFANKSDLRTAFASCYSSGGVPCRVAHGAVTCKLQWDEPPHTLPFDPLLVQLFEGLTETKHPYMFVAHTACLELLLSKGADRKAAAVVPKLVAPLRLGLLSSHPQVFKGSLAAFQALAQAAGGALVPHLTSLLVPLGRKLFDKAWRADVDRALQLLVMCAGPEALLVIRSKIPSYAAVA